MPRKKTHQEYEDQLTSYRDTISVTEQYVTSKTPIMHRCNICQHQWSARPSDIITKNSGCPNCKGGVALNHDAYLSKLVSRDISIVPLDEYAGSKTNIRHHCNVCDNVWLARPNNILNGWGCPSCSGKYHRTHVEYEHELLHTHSGKITVVGHYVTANTYTKHHCNACNYTWDAKPSYVIRSDGCPKCPKKYGWTDNDVIYVWKTDQHHNGIPIYKIGITSARLHHMRIHSCSKSSSLQIVELVRWEQTDGPATQVEKQLLKIGKSVAMKGVDGYTELRALSQKDLCEIHRIIDNNALVV